MNTTLIKEFIQFVKKDAKDTDNCMVSDSLKRFVTYKELEDMIESLDNIGYWRKENYGHVEYSAECSECGEYVPWSDRTPYCGWCGAKMREDGD